MITDIIEHAGRFVDLCKRGPDTPEDHENLQKHIETTERALRNLPRCIIYQHDIGTAWVAVFPGRSLSGIGNSPIEAYADLVEKLGSCCPCETQANATRHNADCADAPGN